VGRASVAATPPVDASPPVPAIPFDAPPARWEPSDLELIGLPVPSPISPAPPPPPDVVAMALLGGRYEVGELLATGGMAEVRRGHDQWDDRDVAIKTLLPELAQDDTFRIRFRREARSASRLSHPTIVSVYDTGEESDPNGQVLTFIVMEYVVGLTLRQLLATDGRLQPRQSLEIASDICVALDVSHDKGIVHRDIKPANVMVTLAGQVKVMDFGIAATLVTRRGVRRSGVPIGTPPYMSPEQLIGQVTDRRSDIYSTGCVLYELLTGKKAFTGSPEAILRDKVTRKPPLPSTVNRAITRAMDTVVMTAMAPELGDRYPTASDLRADLQRALAGVAVSGRQGHRPVLPPPSDNPFGALGRSRRTREDRALPAGPSADGPDGRGPDAFVLPAPRISPEYAPRAIEAAP
jgi:serine/threonine-protein kinase